MTQDVTFATLVLSSGWTTGSLAVQALGEAGNMVFQGGSWKELMLQLLLKEGMGISV